MPLSTIFKKSPKKEPEQENPLGSPKMQKKRYDAAMEFLKNFQERMPLVGGKPLPETYSNLLRGRLMFGSCFNERCGAKRHLTHSPQAYLPAELAVALDGG